jgi:hypothetical protein
MSPCRRLQACPVGPSTFYDAGGKRMDVAWFNGSAQQRSPALA